MPQSLGSVWEETSVRDTDEKCARDVAMLRKMLEHDRKQAGWSVGRAAWRLGVSVHEYRELEAGTRSPSFETWDRICNLFGWPQAFADGVDGG